MANATNVYVLREKIIDSDGKAHYIYPCPIMDIQTVAQFLASVNTDFIFSSFMVPDTDEFGSIVRSDETGKILYGKSMVEDLISIVDIALRHKESIDDIRSWLDICLAQEIIEILIGLSQVKKKMEQVTPKK